VASFTLISFKLCPFVQRSAITLEEKGVPYQITYVDLAAKPPWFLALSPLGKVPVLKVDEIVLFESAVINEYLDEVAGGVRLLPQEDPLLKARDRAWIEFSSAVLMDHWRFGTTPHQDEARKLAATVRAKLERLEAEVRGPLWRGESLTLVDTATAPLLQRIRWTDAMVPELAVLKGLPKVERWTEALLERPSVKRSTVPEIETLYYEYLAKPRDGAVGWVGQHAK